MVLTVTISGCGHEPSLETLDLDGEREFEKTMVVGDSLVLDVRNPGSGGYDFAGCMFDPDILKLDGHWFEGPDEDGMAGDFGRAFFRFTAMAEGESELLIKIRRPWEGKDMVEVYKSLRITVTAAPKEDEPEDEPGDESVGDQGKTPVPPDSEPAPAVRDADEPFPQELLSNPGSDGRASGSERIEPGEFDDAVPVPLHPDPAKAGSAPEPQDNSGGEQPEVEDGDSGWFGWLPFVGDDDSGDAESDDASKNRSATDASDNAELRGNVPDDPQEGVQNVRAAGDAPGGEDNETSAGPNDEEGGWFDWLPW